MLAMKGLNEQKLRGGRETAVVAFTQGLRTAGPILERKPACEKRVQARFSQISCWQQTARLVRKLFNAKKESHQCWLGMKKNGWSMTKHFAFFIGEGGES